MPKHIYTEEIKEFVKNNCKGLFTQELTDLVNNEFGTHYTAKQISNLKRRFGYKSGVFGENGCFPKGHQLGKGKKMTPEQYEKLKPTMFKTGHKKNAKYKVGDEIVNGRGYVLVKVRHKRNGNRSSNFQHKQQYIYEQHYGKIPAGYQVIFADGDNRNFDIDNLILVSKAEMLHMNRNHMVYDNADLTKTAAVIAKVETTINKKKRGKDK